MLNNINLSNDVLKELELVTSEFYLNQSKKIIINPFSAQKISDQVNQPISNIRSMEYRGNDVTGLEAIVKAFSKELVYYLNDNLELNDLSDVEIDNERSGDTLVLINGVWKNIHTYNDIDGNVDLSTSGISASNIIPTHNHGTGITNYVVKYIDGITGKIGLSKLYEDNEYFSTNLGFRIGGSLRVSDIQHMTNLSNRVLVQNDLGDILYKTIDEIVTDAVIQDHNHDDLYYRKTQLQTIGQSSVHWNNLTNVPSTFTPSSHNLITSHTISGLTTGHFLKALSATSFGFAAHGLTYSDVGAASDVHVHAIEDITSLQNTLDSKQPLNSKLTAISGLAVTSDNFIASNGTTFISRKLQNSDLPAIAITDTFVVSSQAAMLALSAAERGDVAVRTDLNKSFILKGDNPASLSDWQELLTPTDTVLSVDGRTGVVSLSDKYQPLDTDLTTIAALTHSNRHVMVSNGSSWTRRALEEADLPSLSAAKITSGTLDNARLSFDPASIAYKNEFNVFTAPSGISIDDVTAEDDGTSTTNWNVVSHMQLASNNNKMAFFLGSPQNERKAFIQVGHTNSNFASFLGELRLNPFGGNVTVNGYGVWHSGNFNPADYQPLDADLTAIAGLTHSNRHVLISNGTNWTRRALVAEDIPNLSAAKITSGTLDNARLSFDPSSFAPAAHSHAWNDITSKPSTFAPASHGLVSSTHTVSGLTAGHVLKALSATTYGFAAITPANIGAPAIGTERSLSVTTAGWVTIATCATGRAYGEFHVYDNTSSRHNFTKIIASTSYGENNVSVIGGNRYSSARSIAHVRVLYNSSDRTYGGAKLQVYCENPTFTLYVKQFLSQEFINWKAWNNATPVAEGTPTGWVQDDSTYLQDITNHNHSFVGNVFSSKGLDIRGIIRLRDKADSAWYNVLQMYPYESPVPKYVQLNWIEDIYAPANVQLNLNAPAGGIWSNGNHTFSNFAVGTPNSKWNTPLNTLDHVIGSLTVLGEFTPDSFDIPKTSSTGRPVPDGAISLFINKSGHDVKANSKYPILNNQSKTFVFVGNSWYSDDYLSPNSMQVNGDLSMEANVTTISMKPYQWGGLTIGSTHSGHSIIRNSTAQTLLINRLYDDTTYPIVGFSTTNSGSYFFGPIVSVSQAGHYFYNDSDSKTTLICAGSSYDASNGPSIVMRGNTHSITAERGCIKLMPGATVNGHISLEGSVGFTKQVITSSISTITPSTSLVSIKYAPFSATISSGSFDGQFLIVVRSTAAPGDVKINGFIIPTMRIFVWDGSEWRVDNH